MILIWKKKKEVTYDLFWAASKYPRAERPSPTAVCISSSLLCFLFNINTLRCFYVFGKMTNSIHSSNTICCLSPDMPMLWVSSRRTDVIITIAGMPLTAWNRYGFFFYVSSKRKSTKIEVWQQNDWWASTRVGFLIRSKFTTPGSAFITEVMIKMSTGNKYLIKNHSYNESKFISFLTWQQNCF